MKVTLDPLPDRKTAAIAAVNQYFAGVAANASMQEAAWVRKREVACAIREGESDGMAIAKEAQLRGLTIEAFADLILSKPDPAQIADARELRRQTALLEIDTAKTPAELDAIIATLGT